MTSGTESVVTVASKPLAGRRLLTPTLSRLATRVLAVWGIPLAPPPITLVAFSPPPRTHSPDRAHPPHPHQHPPPRAPRPPPLHYFFTPPPPRHPRPPPRP